VASRPLLHRFLILGFGEDRGEIFQEHVRGFSDPTTFFWSRGLVQQTGMVECGKNVAEFSNMDITSRQRDWRVYTYMYYYEKSDEIQALVQDVFC
jgi:hypothetical protein